MNIEQQIQERAKEAVENWIAQLGRPLFQFITDALTAQHAATESAHREELERLENKVVNLTDANNQIGKHSNEILAERDTARAEAAQLREALGRVTEAIELYRASNGLMDSGPLLDIALALAAPLLKDGKCPKCGSDDTDKCHAAATFAIPETDFNRCNNCDHQWNHQ